MASNAASHNPGYTETAMWDLYDLPEGILGRPEAFVNSIDWSPCPVVGRDPDRVHGAWTFGNTRLPLYTLFANLDSTLDEFMEAYGCEDRRALEAVLAFARHNLQAHAAP
jgi:uncharacterized protein (DUF433 family)